MNYSIYEKSSGRIDRIVDVPDSMIRIQLDAETQDFIVGAFIDTAFYIAEGTPVAMPEKPSEYHSFDYTTKQWVDRRTTETEWPLIRKRRNQLLQTSDWTQLPDVPLGTKEAWAAYRQSLRDLTDQPDPFNITWPTQPN
jgi:hypothetical protein